MHRAVCRILIATMLAAVTVVVLAGPAEAAHAPPWRWKTVAETVEFAPEDIKQVQLFCPVGYIPVSMEYSQSGFSANLMVVLAEYVDFAGNSGYLRVDNPTANSWSLDTTLNCAHGADVGAITTSSLYLARNETSDRSGGWVDCPAGWRPFSFGAEWEGFHGSRRIDFSTPTENGWYATGYNAETNANLYLEVHCAASAVLSNASYVSAQASGAAGANVSTTVSCPAGNRVLHAGGFMYPMDGSVDPLNAATNGTTRSTDQVHPPGSPAQYEVVAKFPASFGGHSGMWLVARAYCVPVSTPTLLVYTAPPSEQHVRTIAYSFTASDPVGEGLTYQCYLDFWPGQPCTPGPTQNTISDVPTGSHSLYIEVRNDSHQVDSVAFTFMITTAPDAPTVTSTAPTATSASVSFTPGADGSSDVTGFTAECPSTDGGATGSGSGAASPVTVTGLTTGKNYHCRVKATNAVGDSEYSEFGATVLAVQSPDPPTVTGSTAAPGSVAVAFSNGAANGSPITGHTAECVSTNGGASGSEAGAGSPLTVDGLTAGKNYHCRVKSTNGVGDSSYSPFGATVLVPGPPTPPAVTTSTPALAQITVAFAPGDSGGSPVTLYTAECASTDGGGTNTKTRATSPITVTGLTPTKHYRCRVKAANAVGESPYGNPGPEVLVPTLPGKPVVKKSQAKSPTTLKVKLALADDGGSPPSAYLVSCTSSNGGKAGSATSARSRVAVKNLTPGKTYRCKARVRTAAGSGPWGPKGPKTSLPAARP